MKINIDNKTNESEEFRANIKITFNPNDIEKKMAKAFK